MASNKGKQFESRFKDDFLRVPNSTIDRLYDTQAGYKSISQICDFIGYIYPNIFYIECKSHKGNTFPLANLTQYQKLLPKVGIKGVRVGVVIWFIDHDKVVYVPISEITKMLTNEVKSVNVKMLKEDSEYRVIEIPSVKKRVFMESDYSVLTELGDNE